MKSVVINVGTIILCVVASLSSLSGQSIITESEKMVNAIVNKNGDLEITPSENSSSNDFDFFEGKWKVHHRKLKSRLNNCDEWIEYQGTNEDFKILNGIGQTK